jgi:hypothetical protein
MNKPTKEEQKAALELITQKMKEIKGQLIFKKVCINNLVVQECEEIAEKAGISFRLCNKYCEDLTYYPRSPNENKWYTEEDYEYTPEYYSGWMSSTDSCNAAW